MKKRYTEEQIVKILKEVEATGKPAERDFAVSAHTLLAMGIRAVRPITNNPAKGVALSQFGISVVERIPMVVEPDPYSESYLRTKREKLGHIL